MFRRKKEDPVQPSESLGSSPEARQVLQASSEYWQGISGRLLYGAGTVAILAVFSAWMVWSASIGGGTAIEFGSSEAVSAGTIFGFLAAAIGTLQVLTRTQRSGAETLRVLARNEVLSYVALILVPAALGAGVVVLLPALADAPERLDVLRIFGFGGASLLLAVFAADASLASDELFGKKERQEAAKQGRSERLQEELGWLTSRQMETVSTRRRLWRWVIFVAVPAGLLSLVVMFISPSGAAEWGYVSLVAPIFPLTAVAVGTFVSCLIRRQRAEAIMVSVFSIVLAAFLVLTFVTVWVPDEPSVDGIRVREVALKTALLLSVMAGSLLWSSLAAGSNGPLRQIAIYRAHRRCEKAEAEEESAPSKPTASALAWVSLASALLLPPVGFVVACTGLAQGGSEASSRKMFWSAIVVSAVEIALIIAVVFYIALLDPEWTDPVPDFLWPWGRG